MGVDATEPGPAADVASASSRRLLGAIMVVIGVGHFVKPDFFDPLIPEPLGNPRAWVYGSGVAEVAAGSLLLNSSTRRLGAWATFAVILGVWPGNWKMALDAGAPHDAMSWVAWVRLPLQFPLLWWAYRHTRPGGR